MSLIDVIFGDELAQYPHQAKPEPTDDRNYRIDPSTKVGNLVTDGASKVALYEDKPDPTNDYFVPGQSGIKPEPDDSRNYVIDPSTKAGNIVTNGSNRVALYEDKPGGNDPSATNATYPKHSFLAEDFVGHFKNAILTNDKYRLADRRFFLASISPDDAGAFSESDLRDLSFLIQEVDLPTFSINDSQKSIDNELGAFRTPDLNAKLQTNEQNLNIKFLDTEYSFLDSFFFNWMQLVMMPYKKTPALSSGNNFPRASVYVQFFDNANKQMILGYEIHGAYPTSITPPTASYGEGRGGITRQVTFHFNNVEVITNWKNTQPNQLTNKKNGLKKDNPFSIRTTMPPTVGGANKTSVFGRTGVGKNQQTWKTNPIGKNISGISAGQTGNKVSDLDPAKARTPITGSPNRQASMADAMSKFAGQMKGSNVPYPVDGNIPNPRMTIPDRIENTPNPPVAVRDQSAGGNIPNPRMTIPDRIPVEASPPITNRDRIESTSNPPVAVRDQSVGWNMSNPAPTATYGTDMGYVPPVAVRDGIDIVNPRPVARHDNILTNSIERPVVGGGHSNIDWFQSTRLLKSAT